MKASKQQIEQAYDFLEAMFSQFPNALRKGGYVAKMATWELAYDQLTQLTSCVVDKLTAFPSVKELNDIRLDLFSQNSRRAEDAETKAEAEKCYNDHVRGLCGNQRGRSERCRLCEAKELPGVRPETMAEMMKATRGLNSDTQEYKAAFEAFKQRASQEQREDLRKYESRRTHQSEPKRLEVVR